MAGKAKGGVQSQNIIPLKICAKYNPPAVAILYARSQKSSKKYLHVIQLPTVNSTSNPQELGRSLARNEPLYFNPDTIPEKQLIRVLEQIVHKLAQSAPHPNKSATQQEQKEKDEEISPNKRGSKQSQSLPKKEIEDLKRGLHNELKDAIAEDARVDENEDHKDEQDAELDAADLLQNEKAVRGAPETAELPEGAEEDAEGLEDEGDAAIENEVAFLDGFQRVFVEDLKQELLMDPNGNLYDLEGNLIGQAASDDENPEGEGEGDAQYFEGNPESQDAENPEYAFDPADEEEPEQ